MAKNIFMQSVTPEKPKVLGEERLFVYMPPASYTKPGIASFYDRDFSLLNSRVELKWPMKMVTERADPLVQPSMIKVLSDEFENTNAPVNLVHPVTGVSYQSNKGEIKLKRTNRNPLAQPDLVMLGNDFEAVAGTPYQSYRIKRQNPLTTPALIRVNDKDFSRENDIVQINWPFAHNSLGGSTRANGYGMVKVDTVDGRLKFVNNKLSVDKDALGNDMITLIDPLITKEKVGLGNLENKNFTTRVYSEFSDLMKATFDSKFAAKLDKSYWDGVTGAFRDWNPELDKNSVQKWFESLENEDESIKDAIRSLQLFLGIYATSGDLETAYPASEDVSGSFSYVQATDTYWSIRYNVDTWEWYDTTLEGLNFLDFVEATTENIQPNGIPSVGTSGKWVNSDHVHPNDETKANLDTVVQVISTDVGEDDFLIKLTAPTVNIPYVKTAQFLHNWKNNTGQFTPGSNAAYWAGNEEEFELLVSGELPNDSLIVVEEDDEAIAGEITTVEALDEIGVTVDGDEQFVVIDNTESVYGVPVTINVEPATESRGERRRIKPLTFGQTLDSYPTAVVIGTANGESLSKRIFNDHRMIVSDSVGHLDSSPISDYNVVVTSLNQDAVELEAGQLIIAQDTRIIETFSTGSVANKPVVSNGGGGVAMSNLASSKIVKTAANGSLDTVTWRDTNLLKTTNADELLELQAGKVILSGPNNTVESWDSGGQVEALIVRGANPGSIKLRTPGATNRILITTSDGGIMELRAGVSGQMLVSGGTSSPDWMDVPSANVRLPQTRLLYNPSAEDANAFQGLVAVILDSPIEPEEMRNNCIYYF